MLSAINTKLSLNKPEQCQMQFAGTRMCNEENEESKRGREKKREYGKEL